MYKINIKKIYLNGQDRKAVTIYGDCVVIEMNLDIEAETKDKVMFLIKKFRNKLIKAFSVFFSPIFIEFDFERKDEE